MRAKQYCTIVTLDIKNAFNSADWDQISDALERMNPTYILNIISSYLSNCRLINESDNGTAYYDITAEAPQGSELGTLYMMISKHHRIPAGAKIIGFAD